MVITASVLSQVDLSRTNRSHATEDPLGLTCRYLSQGLAVFVPCAILNLGFRNPETDQLPRFGLAVIDRVPGFQLAAPFDFDIIAALLPRTPAIPDLIYTSKQTQYHQHNVNCSVIHQIGSCRRRLRLSRPSSCEAAARTRAAARQSFCL